MEKKILLIVFTMLFGISNAQDDKTIVTYPTSFAVSRPLSELFVTENPNENISSLKEMDDKKRRKAIEYLFRSKDGKQYANDESTIQREHGTKTLSGPLQNWAGLSGGCPSDPTGAAGTNHYVQSINATPFKIFNKTNGAAVGTVKDIGDLWNPIVDNAGDPIVMYDKYADRWFLAQFGDPAEVYIAISKTNDPSGEYYTYSFTVSSFPDYLKFSIWEDGYYMTSNGTGFVNVFERTAMLAGNASARLLTRNVTVPANGGFWCPLPGDADGVLPPAGTPCPLAYYTDNGWGSTFQDAVRIHNMTTNWSATSPSLTVSTAVNVPVGAFDSSYDSDWNDVEQGVGTQRIDAIGGANMYRSQWRKWTGYNTLLLCWAVKMNDGVYATKWVELRQNQSTNAWSLYQEGIYAPDNLSRWVASVAMDDNGSIALAYLCTGKTPVVTPIGLRYTGRLKTDPLGQMTFAEQTAIAGTGASNCLQRVGDYSHLSLDPNGTTFWCTGHYFSSGSKSRIYSFKITPPLGVESFESLAAFNVYQNGESLYVDVKKLNTENNIQIDLFDISGKLIENKNVVPNDGKIDTSFSTARLAKGVYLVRFGNKDFQKVVKTIIK